jgi:hypothetical protein
MRILSVKGQRIFAGDTEDGQAEFNRVCYPLYSGTPGWAEESRQWLAQTIIRG